MSDELRNCPFCGGTMHVIPTPPDRAGQSVLYRPQCSPCGASLGGFDTPAQAITAWNRRAPSAATSSELRERVARAIRCRLHETCTDEPCKPDDGIACGCSYTLADAAIAAMLEHEAAADHIADVGKMVPAWLPLGEPQPGAAPWDAVFVWLKMPRNEDEPGWVSVGYYQQGRWWAFDAVGRRNVQPSSYAPLPAAPAAAGDAT